MAFIRLGFTFPTPPLLKYPQLRISTLRMAYLHFIFFSYLQSWILRKLSRSGNACACTRGVSFRKSGSGGGARLNGILIILAIGIQSWCVDHPWIGVVAKHSMCGFARWELDSLQGAPNLLLQLPTAPCRTYSVGMHVPSRSPKHRHVGTLIAQRFRLRDTPIAMFCSHKLSNVVGSWCIAKLQALFAVTNKDGFKLIHLEDAVSEN